MASFLPVVLLVFMNLELFICLNKLEVSRINPDIGIGTYHFSGEEGIIFNSTISRLTITDLEGEQLLMISDANEYQRWITIHTDLFIQLKTRQGYKDYYIPNYLQKEMRNRSANEIAFKFLDSLSSSYHSKELKRSVESFVSKRTTFFIIQSAYILGRDLNYTGLKYPSILSFYLIAHTLEGLLSSAPESEQKCNLVSNYCSVADDDSCFEECPPCPDLECLSLCGYGCSCWKWVCGDCCYHLGCYGHDICCRENFVQTKCLFPTGFKCDAEYTC